jgi:hypothetical protein
VLGSNPAGALQVLTAGKVARLTAPDSAVFRFGKNRALETLIDPTCPTRSALQVAAYTQASVLDAQPEIVLDCQKWRPGRGGRFVYEDPTAGVRKIVYGRRRLLVRLEGGAYRHVTGPVGYLEVWFRVGGENLLGRFHNFVHNDGTRITTRKPSASAAEGELAFWDVLWGDDPSDARQDVTLHCLKLAAKRDKKDGRSRFLLGMMHLYRFGSMTRTYASASDAAKAEIVAAYDAFQAAVPLLWDGSKGDSRVPGFAAAAKYVKGAVLGDAALVQGGLADLEASVAVNPIFNLFDYIGVVPQAVLPTDPLYTRAIEIADIAFTPENAQCAFTQPEICGDAGFAPHNILGAFLLFGDLYAKGGILSDPYVFRGAENFYRLTRQFAAGSTWDPSFQALAASREAGAVERVALYFNADPADDPLIIGSGRGEACAICHHKQ